MVPYKNLSNPELESLKFKLQQEYDWIKASGLSLDMSRGKPSKAQLDLSDGLLNSLKSNADCIDENHLDCRNYGEMEGTPEARRLMAAMMGVNPDHVIVLGNASLNIMFDNISRAFTHGICGNAPWGLNSKIRFLCPVPGYDRHFAMTEYFGIEMINIPMHETGPDMDMVEEYVNNDSTIKGMWCVPKYSNPQGITYSRETVDRIASLKPAAPDFRLFWDNAYVIHSLYEPDERDFLPEIFAECAKYGNEDMVYEFCSTSKVSYAGAGISAIAASPRNLADIKNHMKYQTISHDKINQLRHVKFFKDFEGMKEHMKEHARILRPKFQLVDEVLTRELGGLEIGSWINPRGGYFISFEANEGCAKEIVRLAHEAGLVLTPAGSAFPYHDDPLDTNIRIAPSLPELDELDRALEVFTTCVKLVSVDKILSER